MRWQSPSFAREIFLHASSFRSSSLWDDHFQSSSEKMRSCSPLSACKSETFNKHMNTEGEQEREIKSQRMGICVIPSALVKNKRKALSRKICKLLAHGSTEQETPPNGPLSILNRSFQILCLYTGKARIYDLP